MAEETFNPGDIVYHKANNLRMVVIYVDEQIDCRFVNSVGKFELFSFHKHELSKSAIQSDVESFASVLTNLPSLRVD